MKTEIQIREAIKDYEIEIEKEQQLLRDVDHRPEDSSYVKTLTRRIFDKELVICHLKWVLDV